MEKTPKSLRLHIGIFGRTNVGKSSFLNMVVGQDVAITSHIAGTTTDVVEKTMELLPVGPVVFFDTAGFDDVSALAYARIRKTKKVFDRSEVVVIVTEPGVWAEFEELIYEEAKKRAIPLVIVVNKCDLDKPKELFLTELKKKTQHVLCCASTCFDKRNDYVHEFKSYLLALSLDNKPAPKNIIADLLPKNGLAVLIIPIDKEAPKGRIILPQVQAIRDCLDAGQMALVVRESEYAKALRKLKSPPDIVVCDSQVVERMVKETPCDVPCTTFSILFSRYRGDLLESVRAVSVIDTLKPHDKILIAEACSHHAIEDDIGRIKIPQWLRKYLGFDLTIDVCSGKDYPDDLMEYKLIIHCGACMINRKEMLSRIEKAKAAGVGITNYGVCIAYLQGVLKRVISPFSLSR